MFTGIVQELGTALSVKRSRAIDHLSIMAPRTASGLQAGESVAVNGACVTAARVHQGIISFDVIPETRRLTNLGLLRAGHRVNVERSLSLSDRLNGHLVLGHVDGLGRISRCRRTAGELVLEIRVDKSLGRYLVPKGPIAVDGVSLTVGSRPSATHFSVHLIPETLRKTTLSSLSIGALVNIEIDYVAKLMAQYVGRHGGAMRKV